MPAGHAAVEVVDHDGGHVHIAPGSVDQMVAADGDAVAAAHKGEDVHLWIGQLDAGDNDGVFPGPFRCSLDEWDGIGYPYFNKILRHTYDGPI